MSKDVKNNDSAAANHDLQGLRSRCEALGLEAESVDRSQRTPS